MGLTLGVDIGGTKVLGGVVDEDGRVLAQARRETPAEDVSRTLDRIIEVITELSAAHEIDAIGMLGMFKRKAEKMIMDTALRELKRRVESIEAQT